MAANFIAGVTLGSKIVHAGMVLIYLMAELVSSRVGAGESVTASMAEVPVSPAPAGASRVEPAQVLAFRAAQAELRKTSSLPALNT